MKVCPKCQKTYSDENLNFCLDDGSVLNQVQQPADAMPETVFMSPPRSTSPQTTFGNQPSTQTSWGSQPPPYNPPPKKSSKTWIWVLGILALVVVLCGGGVVGLAVLGSLVPQDDNNSKGNHVVLSNTKGTPGPSLSGSPKTTTPNSGETETVDLSTWVKENSTFGDTEFTNGEFFMGAKKKGFYYVLVSPDDYTTEGASTKVSLRNPDEANSSMGYGLIFHSNPQPLIQDYAFLIDTKKKKYRVVRHEPQKEISVVAWTNSPVINDGTQENLLEARDKGDSTELYINGQMVTSIKNTYSYKGGVPGLYSGDGIKIAFKDLTITK